MPLYGGPRCQGANSIVPESESTTGGYSQNSRLGGVQDPALPGPVLDDLGNLLLFLLAVPEGHPPDDAVLRPEGMLGEGLIGRRQSPLLTQAVEPPDCD